MFSRRFLNPRPSMLGLRRSLGDPYKHPGSTRHRTTLITEVTSSLADFSTVVEAMHAGPKMRGQERSEFSFEDGSKGDVYRAVLLAIATDPPTISLRYAELMSRINDLCVDKAPVGSSISEACIQIGKIASRSVGRDTGVQGAAPIEWDTTANVENLHVTEPYFLFYLRSSPKLRRFGRHHGVRADDRAAGPPRPADAAHDARRELRGGAGLVQIVPPSGPGRHAEADRHGHGQCAAHPAPVPLLELQQPPDRLRVHRAVGHRGAALEAPRSEVVEGRAGQGPASVRMPWCVGQTGLKSRTQFGGTRQSVR